MTEEGHWEEGGSEPPSRAEFQQLVCHAYGHLYDFVSLRTHGLGRWLLGAAERSSRQERAWRLHQILLDVIREIDPGAAAPIFSSAWSRHRLLVLRYVDGLDPQAVADALSISRRHFYRKHREALDAVGDLLWQRYVEHSSSVLAASPNRSRGPTDRLSLLRAEAARLQPRDQLTVVAEVVAGAIQVVARMAQQKGIEIEYCRAPETTVVGVDQGLLRQVLLELLNALLEILPPGSLTIGEQRKQDHLVLTLRAKDGDPDARLPGGDEADAHLSVADALARLQEIQLDASSQGTATTTYRLHLPRVSPHTVLVIDDNEDVLHLFARYLGAHHYRAVTCLSGSEGIELARTLRPYAVILDLMLPGQDGWEVLQTMVNLPETQDVPVIISTVLSARQLALSLGAAAFLEKPVTEDALLAALESLA